MTTTSHHTPILTIAVAVGAVLLTAGCGIQGENAETLPKPEFVAEFTKLMDAATDGDQAALTELETDEDPFEDINRRAHEYGPTVCGESD